MFTIHFSSDQSITVNYFLEGKKVASKAFTKKSWSCGTDGLTLTMVDRRGELRWKLPAEGRELELITIYKMGKDVYIKKTSRLDAEILNTVPQTSLDVKWYKFAEQIPS